MIARVVLLVAVVTGGGAVARAQDQPAPARPSQSDQDRSRALYEEGSRAYKDGQYQKAVELFLSAYELSHAPAILFNVAQAYRLAGACERALSYYRRSLEEEPDAANRAEVEERIAEMERCADQPAETDAAAGTQPPAATSDLGGGEPGRLTAPAPERPSPYRPVLPLLTIGLGATAAVAGGVIYFQARAKFDEVEPTCPCEPDAFSGWETATDASYVLMGAGVVAAGAGLIWWWRQSHREPRRIGLVPTAGGVGWAGSF